jgi:hypothetical protein
VFDIDAAFHTTSPLLVRAGKVRSGATVRGRGRNARWLSNADFGRSRGCDPIDEFGRLRSFGDAVLMVLVENDVVARAIHGMIA